MTQRKRQRFCWVLVLMGALVPPMVAPLNAEREEQWRNFNNSMNAVSLGFVATAILISMFLVMAIFERFFRPRSSSQLPSTARTRLDLQPHMAYNAKQLDNYQSSKMTIYAREVSVVMPGEDIPTFIAHPAPAPCPPERITWPLHQHKPC